MLDMGYPIERLTDAYLPACVALTEAQGWAPTEPKWRLFFRFADVFGVLDGDDLVGSVVVSRFGPDLAALGMMLVAPTQHGAGIGGALLRHALAEVGDATVILDATDRGRPVYARYGFVEAGRRYSHIGPLRPPAAPPVSRPAVPADLPAVIALDAAVTGADRSGMLGPLADFAVALRVIERAGAITGYAAAWPADEAMMIGPLIADTEADARGLITDLTAAVETDQRWRLELSHRHPQLRDWVTSHGADTPYDLTTMVRPGPATPPGERPRWYLPFSLSTG